MEVGEEVVKDFRALVRAGRRVWADEEEGEGGIFFWLLWGRGGRGGGGRC